MPPQPSADADSTSEVPSSPNASAAASANGLVSPGAECSPPAGHRRRWPSIAIDRGEVSGDGPLPLPPATAAGRCCSCAVADGGPAFAPASNGCCRVRGDRARRTRSPRRARATSSSDALGALRAEQRVAPGLLQKGRRCRHESRNGGQILTVGPHSLERTNESPCRTRGGRSDSSSHKKDN